VLKEDLTSYCLNDDYDVPQNDTALLYF